MEYDDAFISILFRRHLDRELFLRAVYEIKGTRGYFHPTRGESPPEVEVGVSQLGPVVIMSPAVGIEGLVVEGDRESLLEGGYGLMGIAGAWPDIEPPIPEPSFDAMLALGANLFRSFANEIECMEAYNSFEGDGPRDALLPNGNEAYDDGTPGYVIGRSNWFTQPKLLGDWRYFTLGNDFQAAVSGNVLSQFLTLFPEAEEFAGGTGGHASPPRLPGTPPAKS